MVDSSSKCRRGGELSTAAFSPMGLAEALLSPEPLPTPEGGGGSLDGCASNSKRSLEASASISPGKRMRGGVALPSTPSSSAAAMGESQGSSLEQALPRIDSVVFRMADSLFKLFDMMVHLQSPDEIWQRAAAADAADAEGAAAETAVAAHASSVHVSTVEGAVAATVAVAGITGAAIVARNGDSDEASDDGRCSDWGIADDSDDAMAGLGLNASVDAMADVSGLGAVLAVNGSISVVADASDTPRVSLASVFGGSRADPLQWELAAYALLLVEQTPVLRSGTARTRGAILAGLQVDVDAILNTGPSHPQKSIQRQLRGQANLGLVLQVLRRLAGQAPFGWSLLDVSFTPAEWYAFFDFSKGKARRPCFLTDRSKLRWRAHVDAAKSLLLDHPHGELLLGALGAARAELTAAHGDAWATGWQDIDGGGPSGFISDEAAAAAPPPLPPARTGGRPLASLGEALQSSSMRRLQDELIGLREDKVSLENRVAELDASALPVGVLDPAQLHEMAANLLRHLDAKVAAADANALFAGGAVEELSSDAKAIIKRAMRLWHLTHDVLDEALESQPELRSTLEESMQRCDPSKGTAMLPTKVRRCFVLINLIARERMSKSEAENLLPWAIAVFMIANHTPPVALEALREVLDCVVAYKRAWEFLRELSQVIELSYASWWPGQRLVFASDNWQTERSWGTPRLGQRNNADTCESPPPPPLPPPAAARTPTPPAAARADRCSRFSARADRFHPLLRRNPLLQAEYKIVFPLREWHVDGSLESLGVLTKPFDKLRLDDFNIDGGVQRCVIDDDQ